MSSVLWYFFPAAILFSHFSSRELLRNLRWFIFHKFYEKYPLLNMSYQFCTVCLNVVSTFQYHTMYLHLWYFQVYEDIIFKVIAIKKILPRCLHWYSKTLSLKFLHCLSPQHGTVVLPSVFLGDPILYCQYQRNDLLG